MEILELRNKILNLKIKCLEVHQYEFASDVRSIEKSLDSIINKEGIKI